MQPQNLNTNGHLNSLSRQDASSNEARRVPVRTESPVNVSSAHSATARSNTGPISGVLSSQRDSVSSSPDHSQHMLEPDHGMTHAKQPQAGPSVYRPPQQYYSPNFSHGASGPQLQQKRPLAIPSSVLAAAAAASAGSSGIPRQRFSESSSRNESPRIVGMENQPNSSYETQTLAQQRHGASVNRASNLPLESAQNHYPQTQQQPLDSPKPRFVAPSNLKYDLQRLPSYPNSLSQPKFPPTNQVQQRRPSGDQQRYHQVTAPQPQRQHPPPPQQQVQQQQPRRRQSDHTVPPTSSSSTSGSTPLPQSTELPASVIKLAANALTPAQTLFEQAWGQTVLNVQHEMSAMHTGFTMLITAERETSARLRQERGSAREEAIGLRNQNGGLKEELRRLCGIVGSLREEGEKLRKEVEEKRLEGERLSVENEVMRRLQYENGRLTEELVRRREGVSTEVPSPKVYVGEMLDVVRAEFGRHMEVRMSAILKDVQEQKSLRVQAEKKLADAMKQLKTITDTAFASPSFSDNNATTHPDIEIDTDRGSSSERTTVIGTPASQTKVLNQEHEHEHEQEHDLKHEQIDVTSSTADDQPCGGRMSTSSPRRGPLAFPSTLRIHPPSTRELFRTPVTQRLSSSPRLPAFSPTPHSPSRALEPLSPSHLTRSSDQLTCPQLSTTSAYIQNENESGDKVIDRPSSSPVTPDAPLQSILQPPTSHSLSPPCLPPSHPGPSPISPHISSPCLQDSTGLQDNNQDDCDKRRPRKRKRTEFEEDESGVAESTRGATRMRIDSGTGSESSMGTVIEMKLEREDAAIDLDHPLTVTSPCSYLNSEAEELGECAVGESVKREEANGLLEEGEVEREEGELVDSDSSPTTADNPVATAVTSTDERPPTRSKIGIKHIDLLYETKQERMVCRMCVTRPSSAGSKITRVWFPLGASWADLVGHCEKEHPAACEEFEKLSPCQVVELRQRMLGNKVPRRF